MKEKILGYLISQIIRMLPPGLLRQFVDQILDFVEAKVLGTASELDDTVVLPLCGMIREAFSIPDDPQDCK